MPRATPLRVRKTHNLSKGRVSIPGARYFITINLSPRIPKLATSAIAPGIIDILRQSHRARDLDMLCGTIMDDHLHLLFTLGRNLTLTALGKKLKSEARPFIKIENLSWQRNFHDHRLRKPDSLEPFARYVFLNPYRRSLIPLEASWPYWFINRNYSPSFLGMLRPGNLPQPEWLSACPSLPKLIAADL